MRNIRFLYTLLFLTAMPSLLSAYENIRITFRGVGHATKVERVKVDNLTQGTSLELDGTAVLLLNPDETGIEEGTCNSGLQQPLLYPNPAQEDARMIVNASDEGNLKVAIYSLDGVLMDAAEVAVTKGINAISIPTQGYGYFLVRAEGAGVSFSQKWLSAAPKSNSGICNQGADYNTTGRKEAPATRVAEENPAIIKMKFSEGDVLRFTGSNGNMSNIVVRKPAVDQTVCFQFVPCTDADNKHYPTVEVAGMLWMAKDLRVVKRSKLTKFRSQNDYDRYSKEYTESVAYYNFDPKDEERGYYSNDGARTALPEGWTLPSVDEYKALIDFVGNTQEGINRLKASGEEGLWNTPVTAIDELQFGLKAHGHAPDFTVGDTVYIHLNNNQQAKIPDVLSEESNVYGIGLTHNWDLYPVRGVHPAYSAYNDFISHYLAEHPDEVEELTLELGPDQTEEALLGARYLQVRGGNYMNDHKGSYGKGRENVEYGYLDDPDDKSLYRSVSQNISTGKQRVINARWTTNAKNKTIFQSGKVTLTVTEKLPQETEPYKVGEFVIDQGFNLEAFRDHDKFTIENKQTAFFMKMNEVFLSYKVLCADFNGDNTDDILIAINGTLVIIDGTDYTTILTKKEFPRVSDNITSMRVAAGYINNDKKADLVVAYNTEGNIYMETFLDITGKAMDTRIVYESADNFGVVIGNINNDFASDIIIYVQDKRNQNFNIYMTTYNHAKKRLDDFYATTFREGNPNSGHMEFVYRSSNTLLVHSRGPKENPDLVFNGNIFRWENNELQYISQIAGPIGPSEPIYIFDDEMAVGEMNPNIYPGQKKFREGREYIAYNIGLFSFPVGNDYPAWEYTPEVYFRIDKNYTYTPERDFEYDYEPEYDYEEKYIGSIRDYSMHQDTTTMEDVTYSNIYGLNLYQYDGSHTVLELGGTEMRLSEPRIYTVLAAPPYWEAYKADYPESMGTTWGYDLTTDTVPTGTSQLSSSLISGFEKEPQVRFFDEKSVKNMDEIINKRWTATGKPLNRQDDAVDCATQTENLVVMQFTPYKLTYYSVVCSDDKRDIGRKLIIGEPQEPRFMTLTMDKYMELRGDNPEIPDLKEVLRHEVGNPFSYQEAFLNKIPMKGEIIWGGKSKNSMQHITETGAKELVISEEAAARNENVYPVNVRLMNVKTGMTDYAHFSNNENWKINHIEQAGHKAVGNVLPPKGNSASKAKEFFWNVCRFNADLQGQQFPVVTYIVE